jgi:hypothetical protein
VVTPMTAIAARMLIQDGRRKLYLNLRSGAMSFGCMSSSQILGVRPGRRGGKQPDVAERTGCAR